LTRNRFPGKTLREQIQLLCSCDSWSPNTTSIGR